MIVGKAIDQFFCGSKYVTDRRLPKGLIVVSRDKNENTHIEDFSHFDIPHVFNHSSS